MGNRKTPPALTPGQPTPEPFACITRTSWQAALAAQAPIPAELTGKLVIGGPANQVGKFQFQVVGLDGSGSKAVFPGFGALAPDGVHLASTTDNGISIINLDTNQTSTLPGTIARDYGIWTSDSTRIVFHRNRAGDGGIYVAMADGSNLRRIVPLEPDSPTLMTLVGWLPNTDTFIDTTSNLMTSPDSPPMKTSFHQLNLQTSQDTLLFTTTDGYAFNTALSPDGKQLVFSETDTTGDNKKFFQLSNLDGSNRKLLSNGDLFILNPVWSPNSEWLALNLGEYATNETPALMLFNPQTCALIPLPGLTGSVSSWVP